LVKPLIYTEQAITLLRELDRIIDGDRYPLLPRIQTLKQIRAIIRPARAHEPMPAPRHYEPTRREKASRPLAPTAVAAIGSRIIPPGKVEQFPLGIWEPGFGRDAAEPVRQLPVMRPSIG